MLDRNDERCSRVRTAAVGPHIVLRTLAAALLISLLPSGSPSAAAAAGGQAMVLRIDDVIGPATADYLSRGLERARAQGAGLVIIQMDTPGGLDTSMRAIIHDILDSPVPVVSYVYPSGSRAASAGTYILYASHVAAMAPATNLGAATPVQIGGLPGGGDQDQGKDRGQGGAAGEGDAMHRKIVNDAVAYIQGLARLRGRNAEWAERAVREGVSLSAQEALDKNVIDLIAGDLTQLLSRLDGREVVVAGEKRRLSTAGMRLEPLEPDWRSRLLAVITNPNVAYVLMLIGIYGLIYEFVNPGMVLPGVMGTISLLLALFAFQVLPINYAGLALMILGVAFMVAEVFVPSFGALGIGGVIAFVIGSIMLLDTGVPGFGIALPLIGVFAALSAAFFMLLLGFVVRARRRPVVSGREQLIGAAGEALEDIERSGWVRVHGERWRARSAAPVRRGERVRVRAMEGLELIVAPEEEQRKED